MFVIFVNRIAETQGQVIIVSRFYGHPHLPPLYKLSKTQHLINHNYTTCAILFNSFFSVQIATMGVMEIYI